MKKRFFLFAVAAMLVGAGLPLGRTADAERPDAVAAGKKVKTQVTGTGKTKFAAENDAARAAREVSGGPYRTIRRNTTGSGESWICTMTIEYTQK